MARFCRFFYWSTFVLVQCGFVTNLLGAGSIWKKSLELPRQLRSYQFTMTQHYIALEGNHKESELPPDVELVFHQSGDRIRVNYKFTTGDAKLDGPDDIRPTGAVAFDGQRFQKFSKYLDELTSSKSRITSSPYHYYQPVNCLYAWVTNNPQEFWHKLAAPDITIDATLGSSGTQVNGFNCDEFRVTHHAPVEVRYTVFVSTAHDNLPVRVVAKTADSMGTMQFDVIEVGKVTDTDGQGFFFPATIRQRESRPANGYKLEVDYKISLDSCRFNHEIPASTFTISPTIAKNVTDFDAAMKRIEDAEAVDMAPPQRKDSSYFLLVNGILIACAIPAYLVSRLRKSKQRYP